MATPPSGVADGSGDLMDDLLARLLATSASYYRKKNGSEDSRHRRFAQVETGEDYVRERERGILRERERVREKNRACKNAGALCVRYSWL